MSFYDVDRNNFIKVCVQRDTYKELLMEVIGRK